jgi:hypothetical protein
LSVNPTRVVIPSFGAGGQIKFSVDQGEVIRLTVAVAAPPIRGPHQLRLSQRIDGKVVAGRLSLPIPPRG